MMGSSLGNKIKNVEGRREENLGGVVDFDGFEIDGFLGFLGCDQQRTSKINLEENLIIGDLGAVAECKNGVQELDDDLSGGGLCFDDSDIDWLDLDQPEGWVQDNCVNKIGRRKLGLGVEELDEFGEGLCCDDLGDSDIDLCLISDQEEKHSNINETEKFDGGLCCDALGNPINKLGRRNFGIGVEGLDEFGGVSGMDDHLGVFDVDWFVRCLDSNQQQEPVENSTTRKLEKGKFAAEFGGGDLGFDDLCTFDADWFIQCLDSSQEEELVEESTTTTK